MKRFIDAPDRSVAYRLESPRDVTEFAIACVIGWVGRFFFKA